MDFQEWEPISLKNEFIMLGFWNRLKFLFKGKMIYTFHAHIKGEIKIWGIQLEAKIVSQDKKN